MDKKRFRVLGFRVSSRPTTQNPKKVLGLCVPVYSKVVLRNIKIICVYTGGMEKYMETITLYRV